MTFRVWINHVVPMIFLWLCTGVRLSFGQAGENETAVPNRAYLLQLSFPLSASVEDTLRRDVSSIVQKHGDGRPTIILEFVSSESSRTSLDVEELGQEKSIGAGTSFERALGLARWLTGPEGNQAKCIAYLPTSIEGHAVLVALACEEIAAASKTEIGKASIDERAADNMLLQAYFEINMRRLAIPEAAVRAMLDPRASVVRVEQIDGKIEFVDTEAAAKLRASGKVSSETEITLGGQLASFQASQMRRWRWIAHLVENRSELESVLKLDRPPINAAIPAGPWRPAVIPFHSRVNTRAVNQTLRVMEEVLSQEKSNLIFLSVDSPGGDLTESLRLAHALAALDPRTVRVVAFVEGQALGDAAIFVMACDEVWLQTNARLGGSGDATIQPGDIIELSSSFEDLATKTGRLSGELYGAVCPELSLFEFRNDLGRRQYAAKALLADDHQWTQGEQVILDQGLDANKLLAMKWINGTAVRLESLAAQMGLENLPQPRRGSKIDLFIERIVSQAWLPPLLLFLAFMMFTAEMNSPGIGVMGFGSVVCFVLFFWIRFLNGTVEWLEVLLFFGGFLCLALELLVFPGFGIFGFGGILMLGSGVILASQTFIIPKNSYQMNEMAWNMGQLAAIIVGIATGLYFIRKNLDKLPIFRTMSLSPAGGIDLDILDKRETLVNREHFRGKAGVTTTRCNPAGKARIGDEIIPVQSDGELIDEGVPVRVIEVRGYYAIVEPIN